mgnify:CR=1 FL=1
MAYRERRMISSASLVFGNTRRPIIRSILLPLSGADTEGVIYW